MNKYWETFYKKKHTMEHSKFAESVLRYIQVWNNIKIIDVFAGNGRDTKYFDSLGIPVFGMDKAIENEFVKKMTLSELLKKECKWDLVYCRFGIHCIDMTNVDRLLGWTKKHIAIEWRAPGDKPSIFPDKAGHTRKYHKPSLVVNSLLKNGFKDIQIKYGRGLSKYKNEDPLICRIYGTK